MKAFFSHFFVDEKYCLHVTEILPDRQNKTGNLKHEHRIYSSHLSKDTSRVLNLCKVKLKVIKTVTQVTMT